jgi:hypothetical protein
MSVGDIGSFLLPKLANCKDLSKSLSLSERQFLPLSLLAINDNMMFFLDIPKVVKK